MLRIYDDIIAFLTDIAPLIDRIERRDRDLGKQLRRAGSSVALNTAEGSGNRGGTRRQRRSDALGSACEVRACLDVGAAFGYIEPIGPERADRLDKIVATLYRLAR